MDKSPLIVKVEPPQGKGWGFIEWHEGDNYVAIEDTKGSAHILYPIENLDQLAQAVYVMAAKLRAKGVLS